MIPRVPVTFPPERFKGITSAYSSRELIKFRTDSYDLLG